MFVCSTLRHHITTMENLTNDDTPLYKYFEKCHGSMAANHEQIAEIQELVADVENIQSDDEMKVFMLKLFEQTCSIGCYFFHRIKIIESKYEDNLKDVLDKIHKNLNKNDQNTFEIVQSTMIQLYRDVLNSRNGHTASVQVPCSRSVLNLYYENGILTPLRVNSSQIFRDGHIIGRLLTYVFVILNFYEALLRRAENLNEDKNSVLALRFLYYLLRMFLGESDEKMANSSFLTHIAQIFFLLEIDSILLANIDSFPT